MAIITERSDLRTNEVAGTLNSGAKDGLIKHPTHTWVAAADATSTLELFTLKANEVLYPDAFFLSHSAWVATSTIDIGNLASDDGSIAADANSIATAIDGDAVRVGVSLAAEKVVESIVFNRDVVITATPQTAGAAIGDTMSLVAIVALHDG